MMTSQKARTRSKPHSGLSGFYRGHYDAISRYVARRVSPSTHDEIVGATFAVAWRKYDSTSNPSLPWLYRIASYEVARERRRVARQPEIIELHDLDLTDSHPLEDVIDISTAFGELSESDEELLRLVHWCQSADRCALFGPVVRLFGAVTLPEVRRRGLYNSVLTARSPPGQELGTILAGIDEGPPGHLSPNPSARRVRFYQNREVLATTRRWRSLSTSETKFE